MDNNDPIFDYGVYGAYNDINASIPAYNYLDFAVSYHVLKNVELRGGINNLFDKNPPLAFGGAASGTNTYTAYDQLGRQVFLAFTAKL
jgi:iron complex outermembrane recepter protein